MKKSIEAQIEYKKWQNEKKRQEVELMKRRREQEEAEEGMSSGNGS